MKIRKYFLNKMIFILSFFFVDLYSQNSDKKINCDDLNFVFRSPINKHNSDSMSFLKENLNVDYYISKDSLNILMYSKLDFGNFTYLESVDYNYFNFTNFDNKITLTIDVNKRISGLTIKDKCKYKFIIFNDKREMEECFICDYSIDDFCKYIFFINNKIIKINYYLPLNFINSEQEKMKNKNDYIYNAFFMYTEYYDINGNVEYIEKRF